MTTVVIDIGCARHGGDYSIERLLDEFSPDVLYGFDPSDAIRESTDGLAERGGETQVFLSQQAAWTYDGEIGFREDSLNSWVTELKGAPQVPCFDLADFIYSICDQYTVGETRPQIILKMDAEGSEYDLLRHLILRGADLLIDLAWIEWHSPDRGREKIEEEWGFREKGEDGTVVRRAGEMVEWRF